MPIERSKFPVGVAAPVLAGLFGAFAGALVAWINPGGQISWVGLVALPLWLLLEAFLEGTAELLGRGSKWSRIAAGSAVLVGFYAAWILFRK